MKKIYSVMLVIFIFLILQISNVYAYNLDLTLTANKSNVQIGDEVIVTLTLSKGIQAADFTLNYDSNLLNFKSSSLGENFYNEKEKGKILCSWFDTNDNNKFTFSFIAKSSGIAQFSTTTENFYDGNLQAASSYNEGIININLLSSSENAQILEATKVSDIKTNTITKVNSNNIITTNNTSANVNQNNIINNQNSSKYQTTSTSSNNNLPQTGDNEFIFIGIGVLFIIIAVITKIKINVLKDI